MSLQGNRRAGKLQGFKFWSWMLACLSFGLAGCRSVPALTPQQTEGKHIYDVRCAHCHEDNDLNLKPSPPRLHAVFMRTMLSNGIPATDSNVRQVVLAGKGVMPGFVGRFTDEQMAALLAYLHAGLRPEGRP
jgi:mono/diheme cytochrome c family protein